LAAHARPQYHDPLGASAAVFSVAWVRYHSDRRYPDICRRDSTRLTGRHLPPTRQSCRRRSPARSWSLPTVRCATMDYLLLSLVQVRDGSGERARSANDAYRNHPPENARNAMCRRPIGVGDLVNVTTAKATTPRWRRKFHTATHYPGRCYAGWRGSGQLQNMTCSAAHGGRQDIPAGKPAASCY